MTLKEAVESGRPFRRIYWGRLDWLIIGHSGNAYWRWENTPCSLMSKDALADDWEIEPLNQESTVGSAEKWNGINEQWKLERRLSSIELDILSLKNQQKQSLPKRKVTKTVRGWVNVYPDRIGLMFTAQIQAKTASYYEPGLIACVEVTGTYEVFEDE